MQGIVYYYADGQEVRLGDKVLIDGYLCATVTRIFVPDSNEAVEWGMPEGGIYTEFDEPIPENNYGNCLGWTLLDEDIELLLHPVKPQK
ncbi:MAG: hypothetical protein LBH00_12255 [Planctomycetaceae bacterium]|jgi:hypothetical protein|nr:hypothetical protein [Planctomycetaceae bacterium]